MMSYRTAREMWTPSTDNVVPISPAVKTPAEKQYIQNQIQAKQAQIAQLANEIRWLRLELETQSHG
jgi:hypothetical protein